MTITGLTNPIPVILAAFLLLATATGVRADTWGALKAGNHVILMRHALAPGTGDPAGFALGRCETQRNLDDTGRSQARRAGEMLRSAGIRVARVLASRWCRTTETAELMGLGPVGASPLALDSFFDNRADAEASRRALVELIAGLPRDGGVTVLVTHQVNVTGLTRIFPASGEAVVLRLDRPPGPDAVVGRLRLE